MGRCYVIYRLSAKTFVFFAPSFIQLSFTSFWVQNGGLVLEQGLTLSHPVG